MSRNKPLIPAQRRQHIADYLAQHQIAPLDTLAKMLRVSEATVRRDLEWLERQGVLERTHGGARLITPLPDEPAYARSQIAHPAEKRQIGACAASLVQPGDSLFVNSGTTATEVIRHLRGIENLTVITNNVSAALEAALDKTQLLLLGGIFRGRANSVAGPFAVEMLQRMYAAKCFIGVDGISVKHGCTTPNALEAEIARVMMERTQGEVIIVADHSKWGIVSNFEIAPLTKIHTLVSDAGLSPNARAELEARGVRVLIGQDNASDEAVAARPTHNESSHSCHS
jgi:DeoR family fructose operon transcriptional repressor